MLFQLDIVIAAGCLEASCDAWILSRAFCNIIITIIMVFEEFSVLFEHMSMKIF